MSSNEPTCAGCETGDQMARLERCGICAKHFCAEHGHRALGGRKFCSAECAKSYYFHGEPDDDEEPGPRD